MINFPPLTDWFRFIVDNEVGPGVVVSDGYYKYNDCSFFTLLWRNDADKDSFVKEFTKLIARLNGDDLIETSPGRTIDFSEEFIKYIDTGSCSLTKEQRKDYTNRVMARGMRSNDGKFDKEGTRGRIGEILFYLLREQFVPSHEKVQIHISKPKRYSKEPGLDLTEIRKDADGYYLIIGEIKSTKNKIGSYPTKIINQLKNNHQNTFLEHNELYKTMVINRTITDPDLSEFITYLPNYSSISSCNFKSKKKRFLGVINYGENLIHSNGVFDKFKNNTNTVLADEVNCRKVKLVGIKDFDQVVKDIYDYIFIKFLK